MSMSSTLAGHGEGAEQEHEHQSEAEQRIDQHRACGVGQQENRDHRQVHEQVAAIVQTVGADGDRAGAPDHVALEGEQRGGQQTREQKHRDAEGALLERLRAEQAPRGLVGQEEGRPEDEARLDEGADRLGLAVAVAVRAVGGCAAWRMLTKVTADASASMPRRPGSPEWRRAGGDPDRELGTDQDRRDGDALVIAARSFRRRIGAQRSAPSARRPSAHRPGPLVYDVRCRLAKIKSDPCVPQGSSLDCRYPRSLVRGPSRAQTGQSAGVPNSSASSPEGGR